MRLELDHLAVTGASLAEAVAYAEAALGVELDPGGAHAAMGTHNRLLSLGPGLYLEAIAVDPAAPAPGRARWFDLDGRTGPARLSNWIVRTDDLEAALAAAPMGTGVPMALSRGDLSWRMAVPGDGRLPFDGAAPALIAWEGAAHPADRLPDRGCRLRALEVLHPEAAALCAAFPALARLDRVRIAEGPVPALRAEIDTPGGPRVLA